MARRDIEQNVTQSVLERLIDHDPDSPTDTPISYAQSANRMKRSLRRDLEWLLNTRRIPEPGTPVLEKSLYHYGLPDVTSLSHENSADRALLLQQVEATIAAFEPRLARVKVTQLEPARGAVHVMRFQIEGMLMMDPEPELISFDTVLQLSSGEYEVKGGTGA